eukprot:359472-Chlamydomonas_euryale.AAC.4
MKGLTSAKSASAQELRRATRALLCAGPIGTGSAFRISDSDSAQGDGKCTKHLHGVKEYV